MSTTELKPRPKCLLNRTLLFNQENKSNMISEYYLHIFFRRVNIQSMESIKSIVNNFTNHRNRKIETEDFVCLSGANISSYVFEQEDKDYFISILCCLLCKSHLKNFTSLFLHYKLSHPDFLFFNVKIHNYHTNVREAHLVAFAYKCFDEELNKDKHVYSELASKGINVQHEYFGFTLNELDRVQLLSSYLKEIDDFQKLISLESLYKLRNANNLEQGEIGNHVAKTGNPNKSHLMNSNKQVFNQYLPNPSSYLNRRLILFDTVTGEMLDNKLQSAGHKLPDEDYRVKLEDVWIDSHIKNVADQDKQFFKLWNRFTEENKM